MKLNSLIAVLVGVCILNGVSATFNLCGQNEGVDVCSTCNGRRVTAPRPHRITPPRPSMPLIRTICRQEVTSGPKPLTPIGDICNCGKQVVKPAPLPNIPRPSCFPSLPNINLHHQSCTCPACSSSSNTPSEPSCGNPVRAPEEYQVYHNQGATIYLDSHKKKTAPVAKPSYGKADVVSVSIARQLANQAKNSVSERQLQYGSLKEPIVPEKNDKKVVNNHIKEESFYDTRGDVLEIKSNLFNHQSVSSESESSEEDEPKHQPLKTFSPAHLKYDDIGYAAYKPSGSPRYVVVKNSQAAKHDCPHANRRPNYRHHFRTTERPCGCRKDLVVDQSEISEQSVSFENNSEQNLFPRRRMST